MDSSRAAYDLIRDRVNWSTLKTILRSPAHYKHGLSHPTEDKPQFAFGRAVHVRVLEAESFCDRYQVWTGGRRAGKEWEAWKAERGGFEILTDDENLHSARVADAVRLDGAAGDLLLGARTEQTMLWTDAETGIACKGRADAITDRCLTDLKTCRDASPRAFGRASAAYTYHAQLAFYLDGAIASGAVNAGADAAIIAVETDAPHVVQVYILNDDALECGRAVYREMLTTLKVCRERNEWPGYAVGSMDLALPAWAFGSDEDLSGSDLDFSKEAAP